MRLADAFERGPFIRRDVSALLAWCSRTRPVLQGTQRYSEQPGEATWRVSVGGELPCIVRTSEAEVTQCVDRARTGSKECGAGTAKRGALCVVKLPFVQIRSYAVKA